MIIVKLKGGMGNQMFQYAVGRNLSLKHNLPLKFDLSFLKNRNMGNFVYRDYDLDLFNVVSDFNINRDSQILVASEPHFHYSSDLVKSIDRLLNNSVSILLDGYWQSSLYFSDFENQIKQDLTFSDKIEDSSEYIKEMLNKIKSTNSILVNIRRTDYINSFHGVMEMDYINNAEQPEDMINNYNMNTLRNSSLDEMYNEVQTPLLLGVLFFLFQLPFFKKMLFSYFPVLFSNDGNLNINGFLFTSVLFGLMFYLCNKITTHFNTF